MTCSRRLRIAGLLLGEPGGEKVKAALDGAVLGAVGRRASATAHGSAPRGLISRRCCDPADPGVPIDAALSCAGMLRPLRFPAGCRWVTDIMALAKQESDFPARPADTAGQTSRRQRVGGTDPCRDRTVPTSRRANIPADTAHQSRFRHAASKAWSWARLPPVGQCSTGAPASPPASAVGRACTTAPVRASVFRDPG